MYEDLSSAKMISLDIETYDPAINAGLGTGELRGGYIAGVALATDDGHACYYPIAHEEGDNEDRDKVLSYLREQLAREKQPKVGTNIRYDVAYLQCSGVNVAGKLFDIQCAESLLDENKKSYSLESLAQHYVGRGKDDGLLYQYLSTKFGGDATRKKQAQNIWRAPAHIVEDYALSDVELPLEIYKKQRLLLQQQELIPIFDVETDILPMMIAMKMRGVRIDTQGVSNYRKELKNEIKEKTQELKGIVGDININSGKQLSDFFMLLGFDGEKTTSGKQLKTDKEALRNFEHPAAEKIINLKELMKLEGTYLKGYLGDKLIKGRLHAQFDSYKSDRGGTVTGRFSSSKPNLQNIPRGEFLRKFFLPDGDDLWFSDDWSQIEYRLLVHFARGKGALEAVAHYNDNPDTDYHEYTQSLIERLTALQLDRKKVKNINFGLVYGMGKDKLAQSLQLDKELANTVRESYHQALPYVKTTMNLASQQAENRGFVKTILSRRRHFTQWSSKAFLPGAKVFSTYEAAAKEYGFAKRAGTHKALNSVLQGSCADIMKKCMVEIWKSGICDVLGAPLSTIHDELNWSVPNTKIGVEAHAEALRIMNETVKLKVPIMASSERGKNWGACK